jgi:hypothetical protein
MMPLPLSLFPSAVVDVSYGTLLRLAAHSPSSPPLSFIIIIIVAVVVMIVIGCIGSRLFPFPS